MFWQWGGGQEGLIWARPEAALAPLKGGKPWQLGGRASCWEGTLADRWGHARGRAKDPKEEELRVLLVHCVSLGKSFVLSGLWTEKRDTFIFQENQLGVKAPSQWISVLVVFKMEAKVLRPSLVLLGPVCALFQSSSVQREPASFTSRHTPQSNPRLWGTQTPSTLPV